MMGTRAIVTWIRRLGDECQLAHDVEPVSPNEIDGASEPFLQVHAPDPEQRTED